MQRQQIGYAKLPSGEIASSAKGEALARVMLHSFLRQYDGKLGLNQPNQESFEAAIRMSMSFYVMTSLCDAVAELSDRGTLQNLVELHSFSANVHADTLHLLRSIIRLDHIPDGIFESSIALLIDSDFFGASDSVAVSKVRKFFSAPRMIIFNGAAKWEFILEVNSIQNLCMVRRRMEDDPDSKIILWRGDTPKNQELSSLEEQHAELVDLKFERQLTLNESKRLKEIEDKLDAAEEPLFQSIKSSLSEALRKLQGDE